jgi:purine-binding chemotaxis protein CheW
VLRNSSCEKSERLHNNGSVQTTKKIMQQQVESQQKVQQVVVFKIAGEEYGLSIDQIKEVVLTPPITRMPRTQSYVRGVANIRGNVIAIIDLEEKFALRAGSPAVTSGSYTLVIESPDVKMGILVSDVPNTLSVSTSSIEQMFTTDTDNSYITGIIKLEKRLIIMIDIFKVIKDNEAASLQKELS